MSFTFIQHFEEHFLCVSEPNVLPVPFLTITIPPKSSPSPSWAQSYSQLNPDIWLSLPHFSLAQSLKDYIHLTPWSAQYPIWSQLYLMHSWSYYQITIVCYCFSPWVLLSADVFSQGAVSYSNTSVWIILWDLNDSQHTGTCSRPMKHMIFS